MTYENPEMEEHEEDCRQCNGTGRVRCLRDADGRIDYLRGTFQGEMVECDLCHGEGIEQ